MPSQSKSTLFPTALYYLVSDKHQRVICAGHHTAPNRDVLNELLSRSKSSQQWLSLENVPPDYSLPPGISRLIDLQPRGRK